MLQGPLGPYFNLLGRQLERQGSDVFRICFNGGDRLFSMGKHISHYRSTVERWPSFIEEYLKENAITRLVVYGDCRIYHRAAIAVAKRMKVGVWVLEEGYLRPDFITLESQGANAFTQLELSEEAINSPLPEDNAEQVKIGSHFTRRAVYASAYYLAKGALRAYFPHYQHHRKGSWYYEASRWLVSGYRRLNNHMFDKKIERLLANQWNQKFFIVPLQVASDFQLLDHSPFDSVEAFIEQVICSFARHAAPEHKLLFKHHPIDRGFNNYQQFISERAEQLGVAERVKYCHDIHLPTALRGAIGTVTVNSTVGLSSIHHLLPTLALGLANYNLPGLTAQCSLDTFWRVRPPVDGALVRQFLTYLKHHTQINSSFYKKSNCGLDTVCKRIVEPQPECSLGYASRLELPTERQVVGI